MFMKNIKSCQKIFLLMFFFLKKNFHKKFLKIFFKPILLRYPLTFIYYKWQGKKRCSLVVSIFQGCLNLHAFGKQAG